MYDAPQSILLAGAVVGLLRIYARHKCKPALPSAGDYDRVLCAAAMVQAACFGRARHVPSEVRAAAVRSILCFDAVSVESMLGGRQALRSGLRRYLRLQGMPIAGYWDVLILDAVADYLHAARRLRGARRNNQREALFGALAQAATLDADASAQSLSEVARQWVQPLGGRRRVFRDDGAALLWLYGVRAAWLWLGAGGGRSPFQRVSRASVLAAERLLG